VAVDLPGGQTLFVLLRSAASADWAAYLHENVKLGVPVANAEEFYRRIAADRQVWPVNRRRKTAIEDSDNYPWFVRFRDAADPRSVEPVDPDNLAKSFGAGYRLKSLTVQMSDAPVTTGIEQRLGWWDAYRNRHLDGTSVAVEDMTSRDFSAHLSSGSFSTGFNK
jgi:hypothetical protein